MISYKKKSEGEEKAYIEAKTALQCKEKTFSKKLKWKMRPNSSLAWAYSPMRKQIKGKF